MTEATFSWDDADVIAKALHDRFPDLNVLTKTGEMLLERIKTLPVYADLPALPENPVDREEIFYEIRSEYLELQTDTIPERCDSNS